MNSTPSMQDLLEAGVHFGHQVRRGHPRMGEYIYGVRDGVHIVNLELSEKLLKEAAQFAYRLGQESKILLLVGTKKQAQPIIKELAEQAATPFVTFRWIGGLLTNFEEIRKNINKLLELKEKQEKGELAHYTKKEQLLILRRLNKFNQEFGGVAQMNKLPDAIFLVDCVNEKTALTEASQLGIPIIAICDTNSNPVWVTYPIPGNDDASKSIRVLSETVVSSYIKGVETGAKVGTEQPTEKARPKTKSAKKKSQTESAGEEEIASSEVEVAEEEVEKKVLAESERKV